jgi:hypothetical protein
MKPQHETPENEPKTLPKVAHPRLLMSCGALAALGAAAFLLGVSGTQPLRAWQTLLVNYLFWSGMAFGCILFVAILNLTNAHWARPMKRLAEAPSAFLPVVLLLFGVLFVGREQLFPWIREPVAAKAWWLSSGFMFGRVGLGLLGLITVALALVYHSVKADLRQISLETPGGAGERKAHGPPAPNALAETGEWRAQTLLSPVYALLYAVVLSLIAIDLIMSLDPHWVSTLFGAYYFIGSFYTALAALMVLAIWSRKALGFDAVLQPRHFHDLGKLLLAFCLMTGDFFYSQFLVIWYGDLPEEVRYVVLRLRFSPWEPLAWSVLAICFALPFVVLLSRKIKMQPRPMVALGVVILVGMWLERFLLVVPSLWKGPQLPLGPSELAITAGFLGTMGCCILTFLQKFPLLPVGDPLLEVKVPKVPRMPKVS